MGVHDHHRAAGREPVAVHVVVVSTTRTTRSDRSGALVERMIREAGHRVTGRDLVPDDPEALSALLERLLSDPEVEAVFLTGGTGISARDGTVEVLRRYLDKELPGFGELFRFLSYQEIGSAAFLSRATAGVARGRACFAVPGSPNACRLALEKLVLPELSHLLYELRKERPLPASGSEPPPSRWREALEELGARLLDEPGELPEPFRTAPVEDLASRAGQRRAVELAGRRGLLLGFPDLLRPGARVLLLLPAAPWGLAAALHRYPRWVGLCSELDGPLPSPSESPEALAERLHLPPPPFTGRPFAVEPGRLYLHGPRGRVFTWDGVHHRDAGPPAEATARLLLAWSQD